MILTSENNNYYKLLLDLDDLNSLGIDLTTLFGNSNNINTYLSNILKQLNINVLNFPENIEIISFGFKIFYIKFFINQN